VAAHQRPALMASWRVLRAHSMGLAGLVVAKGLRSMAMPRALAALVRRA